MKTPYFSIFIPVYNSSQTIIDTLESVFNQSFTDFEVIVSDNNSKDNTVNIVKKIKDKRLKIIQNKNHLGYSGNLNVSLTNCHSDNIILLAGDDLIDVNTLKWYFEAFKQYPTAGAITRPYYWFEKNYKYPVRTKINTNSKQNILVNTHSSFDKIILVLSSLDQLSSLCFKRNLTKQKFGQEDWISHAYPWLDIFKNHPVIFLNKYPLAVRIGQSGTRSNVYQKSPMIFWKNMIDYIFKENKFKYLHDKIIKEFIGTNYHGLFQIRNYGTFKDYIREVKLLINFNNNNLYNYKFWLYFLITLLTPPSILRIVTDKYKSIIINKFINKNIVINLKT